MAICGWPILFIMLVKGYKLHNNASQFAFLL